MDTSFVSELFDHVYVINLPERTDRKREISNELGKIGLSFDSPSVQLFLAIRPENKGGFPSIGARGCFMSHLGVLEHAVSAQYKSILILEDDVEWTPMALSSDRSLLRKLHGSSWNYLHGGLGKDRNKGDPDGFHLEFLPPTQEIILAHFVGLRREAINLAHDHLKKLLGRETGSPLGGPMHVDGAYNWLRKDHSEIEGYTCVPSLARQRPSLSDITPPTGLKSLPVIFQTLELVRYIRKKL